MIRRMGTQQQEEFFDDRIPYFFSFFLPKQFQKSRFILLLGLFRKGKTCTAAKFHRTSLVICSHSREERIWSFSQINILIFSKHFDLPLEF